MRNNSSGIGGGIGGAGEGIPKDSLKFQNLTVQFLTGETIIFPTEGKTTCGCIWDRVQGELVARGVIHPQIFGLAIKTGPDWIFVDSEAKVSKYFSKEWKSLPGTGGLSSLHNENKGLVLHCRVHFYLETLPPNLDVVSIFHYYLQLRQNLTTTGTTIRKYEGFNLIQSLAYALQSELGDWRLDQETLNWIHPFLTSSPGAIGNLTRSHQALSGIGQNPARTGFIRSLCPTYNMHFYGMILRNKDGRESQAWIGVTPKGIEVYQTTPSLGRNEIPEVPGITFLWANITKLYFERKKFEIRGRAGSSGGLLRTEKFSFSSWNECVPRHLLLLCRSTHQFHLSNFKILATVSGGIGSNNGLASNPGDINKTSTGMTSTNGFGDFKSAITTTPEDKMLDLSLWADGLLLPNGTPSSTQHQRVSVISNASSNSTSGIVSDRVYSLDGSEEDLDLRISDCYTERNAPTTDTSLESLSHQLHSLTNGNRDSQGNGQGKYWYCDSDEDDCGDEPTTGLCRSLLVQTINDRPVPKHNCTTGFCECNSCLVDDVEFEIHHNSPTENASSPTQQLRIHHYNTPSLASEKTLTAVDISVVESPGEPVDKIPEAKATLEDPKDNLYGEIMEESGQNKHQYPSVLIEKVDSKGFATSPTNRNPQFRVIGRKEKSQRANQRNCKEVVPIKQSIGLTAKVASLKSLRTQINPWSKGKGQSYLSLDETDGNYVDFDRKLQQGRYPSTRTVSDNFDTDSDYVQLPPLQPRPPPPKRPTSKLWKFVNVKTTQLHKSCGNVSAVDGTQQLNPSLTSSIITTLPRRKPLVEPTVELGLCQSLSNLNNTADVVINAMSIPPIPPPKPPPKKLVSSKLTRPVEARFITSKPQILIQTAYATPATLAVPGHAQILFRGSRLPLVPPRPPNRRTQSQLATPCNTRQAQSLDNIYDTVANEEVPSGISAMGKITSQMKESEHSVVPGPPLPPKIFNSTPTPIIIRPNNYIDVHASAAPSRKIQGIGAPLPSLVQHPATPTSFPNPPPTLTKSNLRNPLTVGLIPGNSTPTSRSGSVPNNLHNFYAGLQNLKPLSRSPIVYPIATTNPSTLNASNSTGSIASISKLALVPSSYLPTKAAQKPNEIKFLPPPVYSGSPQNQQFKAQLYSDIDYVIFPPKDPRLSQQEYTDSRNLTLTTNSTCTNSSPSLTNGNYPFSSLTDIPPPYLPPPPPYPYDPPTNSSKSKKKPPKPLPDIPSTCTGNIYSPPSSSTPHENTYASLYNITMSSNASLYSSSQYGGYYSNPGGARTGIPSVVGSTSALGLNAENLRKFLSSRGSHIGMSTTPQQIYYPGSTHSAPPLPPYKNKNQVLIENGMRKAVQRIMAESSLSPRDQSDRLRMRLLSRSEDSLYSQPVVEETTENELQLIYNLPPPPPYRKKSSISSSSSPSDMDLTAIRQKCTAMELPLIKALLNSSDGALIPSAANTSPMEVPPKMLHERRKSIPLPSSPELTPPRPPKPVPKLLPKN